ncbi:alpha/beta hydrolase [Pedobacter punctiformis]|uniref:Alpha/beta hydrolase n=1 Tax=Pedobacter punctiformis TaxID=3004097 RepID=A0ABT4L9V9_9SPHI|nr:alpha/beta hydrolase [Pedobacter sp. HCMS5-2]MCZ4244719.1 alpha/beta hydrolase [Pedobacter sp. HCMS5-2]
MVRKLILSFILPFFLYGCAPVKELKGNGIEKKYSDIHYGDKDRNLMDVYLPANRSVKIPFVILIHGGAWTMAGKEYVRDYQDSLLKNGIASASINHRYANNTDIHYPQMLDDINTALNYCSEHAKEWNIRDKGFVMAGVSSGAHLALLYAYTTTKKINAIVEFCGPTNLTDTTILNYAGKVGLMDVIQKMTGKTYKKGEAIDPEFSKSSPITQIKNIPVLIIHGTADPVVNFSQSQQLSDTLDKQHIKHKLVTIKGAGHDLNLKDTTTRQLVYREAISWILQNGQ